MEIQRLSAIVASLDHAELLETFVSVLGDAHIQDTVNERYL